MPVLHAPNASQAAPRPRRLPCPHPRHTRRHHTGQAAQPPLVQPASSCPPRQRTAQALGESGLVRRVGPHRPAPRLPEICRAANARKSAVQRERSRGGHLVPGTLDLDRSGVAQSAEHPAVNRRVESSSLSPRAEISEFSVTPRPSATARKPLTPRDSVTAASQPKDCRLTAGRSAD
jgi:hypothetical protein